MKWNPIDHMNAARAHKPVSGGTNYRRSTITQAKMNAKYQGIDQIEFEYQAWRYQWQKDCVYAVEAALFSDEWKGLEF